MTGPISPGDLLIPPAVTSRPFTKGHARDRKVSLAVVHAMAEHVKNTDARWGPVGTFPAWKWLEAVGLGAHALVHPDGAVTDGGPFSRVLYHAKGWNAGSVGVEVLVPGVHDYASFLKTINRDPDAPDAPYTPAQYRSTAWWLVRTGVPWAQVYSHQRLDPTRKEDPGKAFAWGTCRVWWDRWMAAGGVT